MKWFSNLSIRNKFLLTTIFTLPLMFVVAAVGIWGVARTNTLLQTIQQQNLTAIFHLEETKSSILEARIAGRHSLLEASPELIQKSIDNSKGKQANALKAWQLYKSLPTSPEVENANKAFDQYWQKFVGEYEQIFKFALVHSPENQQKGVDLLNQNNGRSLIEMLNNLIDLNRKDSETAKQDAADTFTKIILLILGTAILMMLLMVSTIWWLARTISRPILKARKVALTVSAGDLNERMDSNTSDEIGELAKAFNHMTDSLESAQIARQKIGETVTNQVLLITSELRSTAHQQASGSQEQAASIVQINSSLSEISQTATAIMDMAENIDHSVEKVASGSNTIEKTTQLAAAQSSRGQVAVQRTKEVSHEVSTQNEQLSQITTNLKLKTANMHLILDLIANIAHETHLLSLNAAIEAAGAGDSGNRFGVVAQEVRTLASRSSQANIEITKLVAEIEGYSEMAHQAAKKGSQKALELKEIAGQAGEVIELLGQFSEQSYLQAGSINELIRSTKELTYTIKGSTLQQKTASHQVLEALTELRVVANQTATSSSLVSDTATELESITRELERAVNTTVTEPVLN